MTLQELKTQLNLLAEKETKEKLTDDEQDCLKNLTMQVELLEYLERCDSETDWEKFWLL